MRRLAALAVLCAALAPWGAHGVSLDTLDLATEWELAALRFHGQHALRARHLRRVMVTQARPWARPWRPRPAFDPVAFHADLERLTRLYRSGAYYHARIGHDLEPSPERRTLVAHVQIDEGPPVLVERVDVVFEGTEPAAAERGPLLAALPLCTGTRFTQEAYDESLNALRAWYREHGFARAQVTKRAEVDLARNRATVTYRIDSGPPALFGEVRVSGTRRVDPAVVRRELAFVPGDPFAQGRLDRSRADLAALGLFRTVRLDESPGRDPRVDVNVRVEEAPPRELRFGVGYDTEELVRGLASWRHYDFLGGGRQLGVSVVASFITRTIAADFLQPHFPGHANRTRLLFAQAQEEEDAWTLDRTRFSPRFEWRATDQITGFLSHRLEYDALSSVRSALETALPGADPGDVFLSGLGVGADWNATDDLLDPTRGFVASAQLEPVGGVLGGDVAFVRGIVEGRVYRPLVGRLLGGARMRLGTAEPTDGSPEIPLFERFYAGGLHSVRGYGRWRVGPLVDDEPIGGRSVVEAAVELHHPITREISAAVFLDAGQVSRPSLTFPLDDLRYGAGLGVRLKTPVGPLRIDLGFPVEPPPGDPRWRAHVSLGAAF